jgi:flagellar basal body P-ring protein FlgI
MFCIEEEGKIQVQNHVQVQVQNSKFKFKFKIKIKINRKFKPQTSDLTPHPSKIINNATYYHQYH